MVDHASAGLTFLATDIEGSTDLWERSPDAMTRALECHDGIIRDAVEAAGGRVFKNVGDGFFTAFGAAPSAIEAALVAQRRLFAETWSTPTPVRVRMALHSGLADEREGDFYGPPVNRVARILAAGHGGQILLSQTVERKVSASFPEGAALRDLGLRRLKDLIEPERLFQLVTADLPADFPPLRTLDARPHNLPAQATPVVGRERQIDEVRRLLLRDDARLVTLTGPSGIGKTRLGLQVAAEVIDAFRDGVTLVDLAVVYEAAGVAKAALRALDVQAEGDATALEERLLEHLRERQLLLVLDNFEQVLESAPLVSRLLREAAELTVLVTSQAPLRLRGEHEYPVPPMALPDPAEAPSIERLADYEAVLLFTERAQAVVPSFRLDEGNAEAVAEIVTQLDGLPLAIELAAARLKLFPPRALVQRLSRRFDFLRSGTRDLPDRQRTLRGALEWSYNLLDEKEKALFRRLSVFDGGFTIEAAERVCVADDEDLDVLDGLESLVDKSLIRRTTGDEDFDPRFERLRTIRDYSVQLLEESGEAEFWRRRHAEHFAELADRMDPSNAGGPTEDTRELLDRLGREYDNVRAAIRWALEAGEGALALRLCAALPAVWFRRGHLEEARRFLADLEGLADEMSEIDRAHALNLSGRFAQMLGDNSAEVVEKFERSLEIYRRLEHPAGTARALMNLGNVRSRNEELEEARALFEEARRIYADLDDVFGVGGALMNLGDSYLSVGDLDQAEAYFVDARDTTRSGRNQISLAFALQYLGVVALRRERFDEAAARFAESHEIFETLEAKPGIAWSEYYRGLVALGRGDVDTARTHERRALGLFGEARLAIGLACTLIAIAVLEAESGSAERAARLLGAASGIARDARMTRATYENGVRERAAAAARSAVGEERFQRLLEEGSAMSQDEALDEALAAGEPVPMA